MFYTCMLSLLLGVQDLQSGTLIYYQVVNRYYPLVLPAIKPSIQHLYIYYYTILYLCFGHKTFSVALYCIAQIYTCKLSWFLEVQDLQSDTVIDYQAVNRHCPVVLPVTKSSIQHFEQSFSL
jgi:hypothetical protein